MLKIIAGSAIAALFMLAAPNAASAASADKSPIAGRDQQATEFSDQRRRYVVRRGFMDREFGVRVRVSGPAPRLASALRAALPLPLQLGRLGRSGLGPGLGLSANLPALGLSARSTGPGRSSVSALDRVSASGSKTVADWQTKQARHMARLSLLNVDSLLK